MAIREMVGAIQTDKSRVFHRPGNFLPAYPVQSVLPLDHARPRFPAW
ncbi:MAG: hypothetical protein MZV64_23945 [Ignavibacteriales bacterium]|nr:hypothetical protein [Ignavibacteriales bacterium]